MIAFLLTSFAVGFVIAYVVPMANGWLAKIPGAQKIATNKFANMLLVGVIVLLGLNLFVSLTRKL